MAHVMKFWLLRPLCNDLGQVKYPWENPWGCKFGSVVRAESEEDARGLVSRDSGGEGPAAWLDASLSTCVELTTVGPREVIISDEAGE